MKERDCGVLTRINKSFKEFWEYLRNFGAHAKEFKNFVVRALHAYYHTFIVYTKTRSYYRKENAASPPREGTMHNLLNKGLFIRSRFARTRYEAG